MAKKPGQPRKSIDQKKVNLTVKIMPYMRDWLNTKVSSKGVIIRGLIIKAIEKDLGREVIKVEDGKLYRMVKK